MLMHANVLTRWPQAPTKRARRAAKEAGEPEPETLPDSRKQDKDPAELKKVMLEHQLQLDQKQAEIDAKIEQIEDLTKRTGPGISASPAAVELAKEHKIALSEISGSGLRGAITVGDVRRAID